MHWLRYEERGRSRHFRGLAARFVDQPVGTCGNCANSWDQRQCLAFDTKAGTKTVSDLTIIEEQQLTKNLTTDQKLLFNSQLSSVRKDRDIALLLSVLAGYWGVDRFFVGDIGMGFLKLFTAGGCGILWIVDWFLIRGRAEDHNRGKAIEIVQVLLADHSADRDMGDGELDRNRDRERDRDLYRGERNRDDYR